MKSIFITDIHFGVRSNSDIFLKEYEKFFEGFFFPYARENGIKRVINLGDTWEDRRSINPKTLHAARKMFFDMLVDNNMKMDMIYGNHDVYHRDGNDINSVDNLLEHYDNINVVSDFETVHIGVDFGLVPWINKNNYESLLEKISKTNVDYLGGHFEIKGFEMTKGQIATHGLDADLFKKFDGVYSGHFHVRSKQRNIQYLSNPFQTTWGDLGLKKGFHVFDSDDGTMTPVDNPHDIFRSIEWGKKMPDPETFKDCYLRLTVKDYENSERSKIDRWVTETMESAYGVQVIEDAPKLDGHAVDENVQSTQAIIGEYVSDVASGVHGIEIDELKKKFIELYEQAADNMEVE